MGNNPPVSFGTGPTTGADGSTGATWPISLDPSTHNIVINCVDTLQAKTAATAATAPWDSTGGAGGAGTGGAGGDGGNGGCYGGNGGDGGAGNGAPGGDVVVVGTSGTPVSSTAATHASVTGQDPLLLAQCIIGGLASAVDLQTVVNTAQQCCSAAPT